MMKSNKEVTFKTRGTYFPYRKPQKLKIAKSVFRNSFSKKFLKILPFLGKFHSAEKAQSGQLLQN